MKIANRLLAVVFSLVLVAIGVIVIVEIIAERMGRAVVVWDWRASYAWAQRTTWESTVVLVSCTVLALVGLALVAMQLKPRRPARFIVDSDHPDTETAITRRGLTHALAMTADDVDGVSDSHVSVGRRRIVVLAHAPAAAPGQLSELREDVTRAVRGRLENLRVRRLPTVAARVSVGRGGRRAR